MLEAFFNKDEFQKKCWKGLAIYLDKPYYNYNKTEPVPQMAKRALNGTDYP